MVPYECDTTREFGKHVDLEPDVVLSEKDAFGGFFRRIFGAEQDLL
jgi:hypothetical protein